MGSGIQLAPVCGIDGVTRTDGADVADGADGLDEIHETHETHETDRISDVDRIGALTLTPTRSSEPPLREAPAVPHLLARSAGSHS
jgi:hypothetical protein